MSEHIPVNSSNLKSVAYDSDTNTLSVSFNKGGIYHYEGITEDQYNGLLNARSKGQYFHRFIKDRPHKKGR
jgi:KTSC domain